jgi:hypothetical protein
MRAHGRGGARGAVVLLRLGALALLAAPRASAQCLDGTLTGTSGSVISALTATTRARWYKLLLSDGVPLGGVLTVSTCSSSTTFDTTLALGASADADPACATTSALR